MRSKTVGLLLLTLWFFCCSRLPTDEDLFGLLGLNVNDGFKSPEVLFVKPNNDARNVDTNSSIVIDFSKPMDKLAMESAIQLSAPGGNTSFTPFWVFDTRLVLEFSEGLTQGKKYEVSINAASSKDRDGNRLAKNFLSTFYTVGTESTPSVVSSDPPLSSSISFGWPQDKSPSIKFSEPMDPVSTNSAVGIEGSAVLFTPIWNTDFTLLTLQLKSSLTLGATYKLRVNPTAKSAKGISLGKEYLVSFGTSNDLTIPSVSIDVVLGTPWTSLTPEPYINSFNGVSKFDRFRFNFTTDMNRKNINGEIRFSPNISGNFAWLNNRILEFTPSSPLETGRTYRLSLSRDFTSNSGISMDRAYSVDFTVNDPLTSTEISLNQINGRTYDASCILNPAIDQTIPIPPDQTIAYEIRPRWIPTTCVVQYEFEFLFNTAGASRLKLTGDGNIFSAFEVDYVSGNAVSSIFINQIDYIPSANPQRVRLRLSAISTNAVRYSLKAKGGSSGLRDINENILRNDQEFLFYGN